MTLIYIVDTNTLTNTPHTLYMMSLAKRKWLTLFNNRGTTSHANPKEINLTKHHNTKQYHILYYYCYIYIYILLIMEGVLLTRRSSSRVDPTTKEKDLESFTSQPKWDKDNETRS